MPNSAAVLSPVLALCVVAAATAGSSDWERIERRAAELAPKLVEHPTGLGRPIADRETWDRLAKHRSFRSLVGRAEGLMKEPLPDQPDDLYLDYSRTGNRSRWQRVAGQRRSRITTFTLAECLESKGRFLPPLAAVVRAVCEEKAWVYPAHDRSLANFKGRVIDVDLASSALGWNLATADSLLGDSLEPDVRKLIRDHCQRRVIKPFRDMAAGKRKRNWWMTGTNNWNAVCLAGVTGTALAMVDSREQRALFVAAAEHYSTYFLRGFTPDGYCSEGVGYWNYGFGHYLLLAETIAQATGGKVDLMARKGVEQAATFGARVEIVHGVYPAFADCSPRSRPDSRAMAYISRRLRLGLDRWDTVDTVGPSGALFTTMMYSLPNAATQTPPAETPAVEIGLRSWFGDAGVLLGRPAEGSACRMGVALKGGHNAEHHNHNDVGSYVVVVGSQTVLVDPGAEVYTARTFSSKRYVSKVLNSWGHPVPLVAGQLQQSGRRAQGKVLQAELTDDADTLVLDIASAYKVKGLERLVRTFVYSRKGAGSLTVTDEVAFAEPQTFGTALVTFGKWQQLDDGSLVVWDGKEAVRVALAAVGGELAVKAEKIREDVRTRTQPTRIGLDFKAPVAKATITMTITPTAVPKGKGE